MKLWRIIEGETLSEIKQTRLSKENLLENWIVEDFFRFGIELLIIGRQGNNSV